VVSSVEAGSDDLPACDGDLRFAASSIAALSAAALSMVSFVTGWVGSASVAGPCAGTGVVGCCS
jgi:hypothetical protein